MSKGGGGQGLSYGIRPTKWTSQEQHSPFIGSYTRDNMGSIVGGFGGLISRQIIPASGPKVCRYYLYWAFWILTDLWFCNHFTDYLAASLHNESVTVTELFLDSTLLEAGKSAVQAFQGT